MHTILLSLALTLAPTRATAPAATPAPDVVFDDTIAINDELTIESVSKGVYRIVHLRPWAANSLLVAMPDDTLVLCDTPYDAATTGALLVFIRKHFGRRKMVAINSHFHADALGGNEALRVAGVRSYGSELTARMLKERGATLKAQLLEHLPNDDAELRSRFEHAEWLPPDLTFAAAEGLTLDFGGEKVVLFYPGAAHAPDNIVTWFPARRLLFGGCLVRTAPRLPNVSDADLDHYPLAVENLRRFDADTIVPGHGPVGGPELLDVTLQAVENHRKK